jgi:RNA polymerase sigma factor for flagellar operon FliA
MQTVLGLYYQEECTLAEIGQIIGVTESRVCQILGEATVRLRASLGY